MTTEVDIRGQDFRKNVAAIHTSGELSLLEKKVSNVLLLHAYDTLLTERTHSLPYKVLTKLCGYDSKDTGRIKKVLKRLMTTAIEFDLMEDGEEHWEASPLLSYASMFKGIISWRYDESMAARLYEPRVYSIINIGMQRRFKSAYAYTLYENCSRYRAVKSTGWWELAKFQTLMVAQNDTYRDFRRLNEKVITPAIEEINEVSDIVVQIELRRSGRGGKVTHLRFHVSDNPQRHLVNPHDAVTVDVTQTEAYKALRALNVSERLAEAAVLQDEPWALEIAEATTQRVRDGTVKNPGAYAAKLLQVGAEVGTPAVVMEMQARQAEEKRKAQESEAREKARKTFESERIDSAMKLIGDERRKELLKKFLEDKRFARHASMADLEAGRIGGAGAAAFAAYVTNETLGAYTESSLDAYIAEMKEEDAGAKSRTRRKAA